MGIQGPVSLREKPGLDALVVDACALCPPGLRFAMALALGVLGVRASFTWLLGSTVLPPQLVPGEEAWACAGRPADQWAFHPTPGGWPWRGGPGYPGSEGCWCALPHSWGGLAVLTTRTGWAQAELGPALGEGVASCLWSHGRRGPGFGVQRPCALSCPVTLGRSPALRPHVHTSRVKLTSGARAPQSRL